MSEAPGSIGELNNRVHGLVSWLSTMRTMAALPDAYQAQVLTFAVLEVAKWIESLATEETKT